MNRGFVIMAQDIEGKSTYQHCANVLKNSILKVMPNSNVTIITNTELPYGDLAPNDSWKLINDWQVYEASPYDYTIKLEADMVIPRNIDHWWDILKDRDVVVSTTIRDFRNNISDIKYYRAFIENNSLPNCYNAITYFKKSEMAKKFFDIVRNIFENWNEYKYILQCDPKEQATTDWVYAIACHILGVENTTLPTFKEMSMVHMKRFINDLSVEDWTKALIYEQLSDHFRINTYPQRYPFHYHIKEFSHILEKGY